MAAIVGPGGPSMATKFAKDSPGDQLWRGTTCGVTVLLCQNLFPCFLTFCSSERLIPTHIFK